MKKSVFTLIFCLALAQTSLAQIEFGPRVSLIASQIHLESRNPFIPVDDGSRLSGFQVGFYLREKLPLKGWYIQPEMLYGKIESRYTIDNNPSNLDYTRIDVPIMLGRKLGPVRLNAGPLFRYIAKAETTYFGQVYDVSDSIDDVRIWWQAGIGTDIKGFVIDLKFGRGDTAFGENSLLDLLDIKSHRDHWVLSLGYRLIN